MILVRGNERIRSQVDTGSVYLFVGGHPEDPNLTCPSKPTFYYGAGFAEFCPATAPLKALGADNSVVEVAPNLKYGDANFKNWVGPHSIIGVSGNMEGENLPGVETVIDQLRPDHMSFQFPNGGQNSAIVEFAALPPEKLRGVAAVPLVSPGSLKYGYTANISRVDFMVDSRIRASIVSEAGGVFLERDGQRSRIAEKNLAFFDTGATLPFTPLNGDISLLSNQVAKAPIPFTGTEAYDKVQFTLDVGNGDHVVLVNDNVKAWGAPPEPPFFTLPAASDFPPGLVQFTSVVGLGTLSLYDFQFTFKDGRATSASFVSH